MSAKEAEASCTWSCLLQPESPQLDVSDPK